MNNKGQALIETLFLGGMILLSISFVLNYAFFHYENVLLDELLEKTLICIMQSEHQCETQLYQKLSQFHFKNTLLQVSKQKESAKIILNCVSPFNKRIEKEREIVLALQVSI